MRKPHYLLYFLMIFSCDFDPMTREMRKLRSASRAILPQTPSFPHYVRRCYSINCTFSHAKLKLLSVLSGIRIKAVDLSSGS